MGIEGCNVYLDLSVRRKLTLVKCFALNIGILKPVV